MNTLVPIEQADCRSRLTVLVLGYVWPEPNSSAAGRHMLSILNSFLSAGWDVTFASPALQGEHKIDLTALGIKEQNIALNCTSFDRFVESLQPDIVLFDRFMLEEQFGWRVAQYCPEALRILDTEDLHSLRHARHQAVKQGRELQNDELNSDMAKREVASIFRCDLSLIISAYEYQLLQQHYQVPKDLLLLCPFMIDLSNIQSEKVAPVSYAQRQHFITIGNFRHEPNWDAVLWLKQAIWPQIRAQLPEAELHIYGAYPPKKATQLHNPKQGFCLKGWAADAQHVMTQARVCLAPLRFGAGLKGKLVEAMLCDTPSVTTNIGSEGMHGLADAQDTLPWPGYTVDFDVTQQAICTQEFAQRAIVLYQHADIWHTSQTQNKKWLFKHFNAQTLQPQLINALCTLKDTLKAHRRQNFIGQMLQHHALKSTQYMAQWIEAKNRIP
jgi:O-antigen biosynthesis protein